MSVSAQPSVEVGLVLCILDVAVIFSQDQDLAELALPSNDNYDVTSRV